MRLFERLQQDFLSGRGCRPWFCASAAVVSKCMCLSGTELSGSGRSQSLVLTLASFSAEQSPGPVMCQALFVPFLCIFVTILLTAAMVALS